MTEATVVISFYNRVDYLRLLIAGFEKQSFRDFEVIIADDGSSQEAVSEVNKIIGSTHIPVRHVWHEDKGFRKNRILNKAITAAGSEYLIFVDGDCIPHSEFVSGHLCSRRPGTALTGRRVNLSEKITRRLTAEMVADGYLERNFLALFWDGIFGDSYDVEKGIYLSDGFLRNLLNKKKRGLLGCNFSLYRDDLLRINGFDERYEAPSIGEDSDVQYRLEMVGTEIKSLNHAAVQYHLYHQLQPRRQENLDLFEQVKKDNLPFTPFGIKRIDLPRI